MGKNLKSFYYRKRLLWWEKIRKFSGWKTFQFGGKKFCAVANRGGWAGEWNEEPYSYTKNDVATNPANGCCESCLAAQYRNFRNSRIASSMLLYIKKFISSGKFGCFLGGKISFFKGLIYKKVYFFWEKMLFFGWEKYHFLV